MQGQEEGMIGGLDRCVVCLCVTQTPKTKMLLPVSQTTRFSLMT